MDNEDSRSGTKKKKRSKPIEIGFDSDNDKPIGSFLKLKRNKKKVSFASEGSCGGDFVKEKENSRVMDDNDTLATFRKRLKGPKRDQGYGLNVAVEGNGLGIGGSGKGDDDMQLHHDSDQHMEESLSTIFHKAQSSSGRKSRAALGSKQKKRNRNVDSGLKHGSESLTDNVDSVVESRSGSASALKSVERNHESDTFCSVFEMENQKGSGHCLQEEKAKGICDSNIPDEPTVDHSNSIIACDGDREQLSNVQVENVCGASEKVTLQEKIIDDSLNQCSSMLQDVEIIDIGSPSKVGERVCGLSETGELENNRSNDEIAEEQVCNGASEGGVSSSAEKEVSLTCHTELLNKLNENNPMVSGKAFQESSINGGKKLETEFVSGRDCYDYSPLETNAEVQDVIVGCSPEKHEAIASGSLSSLLPNDGNESEWIVQSNHPDKPLETCNIPKYSNASILKCSYALDPNQSDGSSIQSSIPDENGNTTEYHASVSDFADNGGKISSTPRATRKTKMNKHGDMTYEGDADWEILINDKTLIGSQDAADGERTLRKRVKQDSSLIAVEDSESVAVAAVSAGLKARAVGPIEKIKFKEILKRKGGLKEYLDCRYLSFQTSLCICLQLFSFPNNRKVTAFWAFCLLCLKDRTILDHATD